MSQINKIGLMLFIVGVFLFRKTLWIGLLGVLFASAGATMFMSEDESTLVVLCHYHHGLRHGYGCAAGSIG